MVTKFDREKVEQQLVYISISLGTIFACMIYTNGGKNWSILGKLESLILPIVFVGLLVKVCMTKYYSRKEKDLLTQQKAKRKSVYLPPREIVGGLILQLVCCLLYAFICIILGAPVLQNYEETFVLALLLTITTVSPAVLILGGSGALQLCFCEKVEYYSKSDEISLNIHKYELMGTLFGAWAASVVSPLDWDRDWQAYPIPNVIGALLGNAIGNLIVWTKVLFSTAKVFFKKTK
ncbi:uncharacterized protein LOC129610091 [Condylostylus longicornis]|uniref:uncharacterized protein LOC129610091 n=1 Tax=Condylostylus longicornis TaxID=2530218 RepID=UPI00244DD00B|nr:uncharacterized protein LOC129610091 [Condylostylus longicornis]